MTPKERFDSMMFDLKQEGYNYYQSLEIVKYTINSIINLVETSNIEKNFWFEVYEEAESR